MTAEWHPCEEECRHRWEITPSNNKDFDFLVFDDDDKAVEYLRRLADEMEDDPDSPNVASITIRFRPRRGK